MLKYLVYITVLKTIINEYSTFLNLELFNDSLLIIITLLHPQYY